MSTVLEGLNSDSKALLEFLFRQIIKRTDELFYGRGMRPSVPGNVSNGYIMKPWLSRTERSSISVIWDLPGQERSRALLRTHRALARMASEVGIGPLIFRNTLVLVGDDVLVGSSNDVHLFAAVDAKWIFRHGNNPLRECSNVTESRNPIQLLARRSTH
jgi:hypothetical protein